MLGAMWKALAIAACLLPVPALADSRVNVKGYDVFCDAHADLCQATAPQTLPDSPALQALLAKVQRRVNGSMTYRKDSKDAWTVGAKAGDCEDYAATKLRALLQMGLPRGAMRFAFVQLWERQRALNGDWYNVIQNHMVLTVQTTTGTYFLDNLRATVGKRGQDDYSWFAFERPDAKRPGFYSDSKEYADFWTATDIK